MKMIELLPLQPQDNIYKDNEEGSYIRLCKEVDNWFMMGNPWPVCAVVVAYLLFVLKIGPEYMSKKEPIDIKYILLIHNFCQTVYNGSLVSTMFTLPGSFTYTWTYMCNPMEQNLNPYLRTLNVSAWHFFMTKILDLLDTIFFVLRKKKSHVTFLHVYHHTTMVLISWSYLKYIKGEQGAMVGWINCWVHTVMYSYYFLSALGPSMRRYLWWKKYLTGLQIVQFVIIIFYLLGLLLGRCKFPESFSYFMIFQIAVFLILFTNFYTKAYTTSRQRSKSNVDNQRSIIKNIRTTPNFY